MDIKDRCRFCGEDTREADHMARCCGRQGHVEAQEDADAFARTVDPDTSHAAAAVVDAGALETRTMLTLRAGPLTTEEIALRVGVPRDSISPRMRSLERKGLAERVGKRRNVSGVLAITWGLTDLGYLTVA